MRLYISNTTRQVFDFMYTLPEETALRSHKIPPLTQQQIGGDFNQEQLDAVLRSHRKYGLREASEMSTLRGFCGIVYSVDRPCGLDNVIHVAEHNIAVLVERGRKTRDEAAVAVNADYENAIGDSGTVRAVDITLQREQDNGGPDVPQLSEGLRVAREGGPGTRRAMRRQG